MAIIISYPKTASGIMVILKTSTKYRKFFPNLVIKTTDFRLVFNFEQTRTFTIFGEHGIIPWAHTICVCNRLLFYGKRYWIYRLFYLQRYYNQWLQTSTHTELYLVSFQQIMFKLGKLTDFKEPLQLPCWGFSLAFSCTQRQFSEEYLFGRRFEILNFRNICCKISCLPASPRIFEHLKNGIIAYF